MSQKEKFGRYSFLIALVIFIAAQGCNKKTDNDSWRFINAPDLHNSEIFVHAWESAWKDKFESYEAFRENELKKQQEKFSKVYDKHQAELFVSPGDCNSARWDSRWGTKFRKNFRSVPKYAELSNEEIILEASELCYTALNELVYSAGFKEFLMSVGDHEIGDNPWPLGSEAPTSLPYFRQGFANHITLKKPGGESRFNKKIGKASPRPITTIYENTSNAVQYKNVLFVTLDVFRYDGEETVLGDQGLVCGDISGKHLEWFENVLKEAQDIPSIKHIIVQSHLPIIYPVRKYASSGMMMSGTSDNILLKTMRKYNVDLYLAGEVHMNTVTKDPESDLIQFVGRGNNLTNYAVVEVEDDKLTITSYKDDDTVLGEMIIDKTQSEKIIEGKGMLEPINPQGLQIHWSFDERKIKDEFSCSIGSFPELNRFSILEGSPEKLFVYPNTGDFGKSYSLFGENVELADGISGKAIKIDENSKLFAIAIGPMYSDFERTVAGWVKTSADGRRLILNSNSRWRGTGQFFNLSLNNGFIELSLRPEIAATANEIKINDGLWHHIAVVVPKRNAVLTNCLLYVDGNNVQNISYENGDEKINTTQSNWMTIATQSNQFKTDLKETMNMSDFTGMVDDFCIWTRALNSAEIEALYKNGQNGINAEETENTKKL
jgi:hypothetical protein